MVFSYRYVLKFVYILTYYIYVSSTWEKATLVLYFHMLKNFLLKKLVQSKLKGLPQDQQDMIMTVVTENPDLFKRIADEVKAKTKNDMNEQMAMMAVMREHQGELQQILTSKMK